jgi:D-serine deaminase-like pyridoxal phosphate-dependent protein
MNPVEADPWLSRVRSGLDSLDVAVGISRALEPTGLVVGVLIDVETGLRRVGVEAAEVEALAAAVAALPQLELFGVMTHEGHIARQAGDDEQEMARLTRRAAADLLAAGEQVRAAGVADPVVSMGCTTTWRFVLGIEGITEIRPGSYVFYDRNCIRAGAATVADIAAVVVATVVSTSRRRNEFVLDAGSKSLASERRDLASGGVSFAWVPEVDGEVVRLSEEHGVVGGASRLPAVGERLVVVPNHVCLVVNLYDSVVVAGDGPPREWLVAARGKVR